MITVSTDKTTNSNRNDKSKSASADALCPDTQDDMTPAKCQRRYVSVCLFVYGGGVAEKKNRFIYLNHDISVQLFYIFAGDSTKLVFFKKKCLGTLIC